MNTKNKNQPTENSLVEKKMHDETMHLGIGGDSHQIATKDTATLTTQTGVPIADDQNTLKAGVRGPALLEDFIFREKIFHFDHERIPERVVHARGFGAHGYFETYESLSSITKAHLFQKKGQKTPAFVRFSTVAGNKGSPDLARDVRGFAVKLYTQEGNWDLVGNNIPVFFIQDPIKFPDIIHAAKDEPDRGFPQAQTAHDNFWDFISLTPESMHMVMWIMSDRTIPRSFRFMEGFGVHTFRLTDKQGKTTFVKFHWKPKFGMQSVTWDEAVKINGADPDFHRRDLWNAIQAGDYPEWELGLQLFDEEFSERFAFDILDATKLIPEEEVPIQIVGRLVLDRCVDNFFAETEQVAFCTQNIVPGIDFSNDPLLQGRNFSYLDTQIKRLGSPNFTHLPINAPKCPFANFQQDGHMAFYNPVGRANYNPNSWHEGPREDTTQGFRTNPEPVTGIKERIRPEQFADHYSQAYQFYISQHLIEQQHISDALIFELSKVEKEAIRVRMVSHLLNIDTNLAQTVAKGLGIEKLPSPAQTLKVKEAKMPISNKLSILKNPPPSFAGRKVGILIENGASEKIVTSLIKAIEKEQATYTIIAARIGGVYLDSGIKMLVNEKIGSAPAALFDSVALILAEDKDHFKEHCKVHEFIKDAYLNKKFIGHAGDAQVLFKKLNLNIDMGFIELNIDNQSKSASDFIQKCRPIRFWERLF
jgi:catalase